MDILQQKKGKIQSEIRSKVNGPDNGPSLEMLVGMRARVVILCLVMLVGILKSLT